jgi:hypothetical protein
MESNDRQRGFQYPICQGASCVDIGVKQDGLLDRTQIPHGIVFKVGDILDVEIVKLELERGRIGLGWFH